MKHDPVALLLLSLVCVQSCCISSPSLPSPILLVQSIAKSHVVATVHRSSPTITMAPKHGHMVHTLILPALSLASTCLLLATIVILLRFSTVTGIRIPHASSTALAAASLNITSLLAIVFLSASSFASSLHQCLEQVWILRSIITWTGFLIALIAAILSLHLFILLRINAAHVQKSKDAEQQRISVTTSLVLWTLASLAQLFFYAIVLLQPSPRHPQDSQSSFSSTTSSSLADEKQRNPPPHRPPTPPSPYRLTSSYPLQLTLHRGLVLGGG